VITVPSTDRVRLVAVDDGRGPAATVVAGQGLAMVVAAGGAWKIDGHSGVGAEVTIDLPC